LTGVIEATSEIGGNVGEVAKSAVGGAIDAAGTLGQSAVKAVRGILVGAVSGLKEVACAAWPKSKAAPEGPPKAKPAPETLPERKMAPGKGKSAAEKPDKDEKWTPA
ncbi:MAG TPA: hypothetical protein VIN67_03205, partial [Desulfobaccales bacterium]